MIHIAQYDFILRLMILRIMKAIGAISFYRIQCKLILHNVKSYDTILFHRTQYKNKLRNRNHRTQYIITGHNIKSCCLIWIYKAECCYYYCKHYCYCSIAFIQCMKQIKKYNSHKNGLFKPGKNKKLNTFANKIWSMHLKLTLYIPCTVETRLT